MKIPYKDFGGKGKTIYFAHANGYPPGCYSQFISGLLDKYSVLGIYFRPLWKEKMKINRVKAWWIFAQDLITLLEQRRDKEIIGIGHSLGAMAVLLAAFKRADLFNKIILIEPVIFSEKLSILLSYIPLFIKKYIIPQAKIAKRRRDIWDSKEIAFAYFRKKRVFAKISDHGLRDYVNYGLRNNEMGKMELFFTKRWEMHLYTLIQSVWKILPLINNDTLAIRGEYSNVIDKKSWKKWERIQPKAKFLNLENCGHLLPFEKPFQLANVIDKYIG